jgi:hypothetical protein
VATLNFYDRFLVVALLPICIGLVVFTFVYLPLWCLEKRDMSDDPSGRLRRASIKAHLWRGFLFSLFLLYPGVSDHHNHF